jgi:hypothetical protein
VHLSILIDFTLEVHPITRNSNFITLIPYFVWEVTFEIHYNRVCLAEFKSFLYGVKKKDHQEVNVTLSFIFYSLFLPLLFSQISFPKYKSRLMKSPCCLCLHFQLLKQMTIFRKDSIIIMPSEVTTTSYVSVSYNQ